MGLTFHKSDRIASPLRIEALAKSGKWSTGKLLKFSRLTPGQGEGVRLAVSVPKKLFKRAVARNLLKRRIREAFRQLRPEACSMDLLIVYRSSEIRPYEEIHAEISDYFSKLS